MIRADNLHRSYGPIKAVNGISFKIERAETFGLLGPNGAGKTTTIHMLIGALRPDAGQVAIDGESDPTRPDVRKRIGIAPQKLSLYETLTAEENLRFIGRMYGVTGPRLKERVAWALEFAELTDRRKSRVKTFSGGMQRRLNLACALLHDPPVLLLDEPTVGVDPQSRNHIFEAIEALKAEGRTILYTTHYMEEAQRLCDRVAILDRGKILDLDTVDNLISRHGGDSVVTANLERPPSDPSILPAPLEDGAIRFETERPFEEVLRLSEAGVKFATLHVDRPDLESVFLALTGRRLRD